MGIADLFASINVIESQSLVIGLDGNVRLIQPGEQPLPGELVINLDLAGVENKQPLQADIQQISPDGEAINITQDIDGIISAIEQGIDPTLVDPELAPAAGGPEGSSLALSGTIGRDGAESLAETVFVTQAGRILDLSKTQSLGLLELLSSNQLPEIERESISFEFSLTQGDMTLSGNNNKQWNEVDLSASFAGSNGAKVTVDDKTGRVGISDGADRAGPVEQIQYDRESGISEKLSIKLSSPATSGSFLISRLFADEGEGANNHESGSWVAKLNGIVVASGEFDGEGLGRGNRGEFDIDTGGFAFDEIVFSANEYSQGLQDDREKDSSDYFVEGIEVEASNNFAVLETTDPSNPTSLEIPQSTIFSQLDDSNNRSYQLTASSLTNSAAGVVAIENGKIVFKAASGFIGSTTIEFEVTDQDNNVKVGVINVDVKETPEPATVETLNADNVAVSEGDDLLFTVELDKVTLSETTLDFQLTSTGGDILDDIHLDQLTFTNGVKYTFNADGSGQFVIPESVGEFEIYLPTNNAGDGNRGISLTVAAHETTVYLADDIDTLSETDTATDDVELLIGSENDDVLEALGGNDILIGGLGNDILKGGDGEDIFKWLDQSLPRNDHDIVSDFELGTDKIDVSDLLSQDADLNALLGLVEIIKQDDNSVSITLPIESGDELNLTLTNNSVAQFDSYSAGQISGDALNHLVTDIFVNLPE